MGYGVADTLLAHREVPFRVCRVVRPFYVLHYDETEIRGVLVYVHDGWSGVRRSEMIEHSSALARADQMP